MNNRVRALVARAVDGLLGVIAAGSVLATALAAAASLDWVLDLFAHFRVQYLGVQIVLAIVLVLRGSRRLAAVLALAALVNGYFVLPYAVPSAAAAGGRPPARAGEADGFAVPFTLVTVNVAARNDEYERLFATIARERPDVVVVEELTPRWAERFRGLDGYPYRVARPLSGPFGIAVFSRWPLESAEIVELGATPAVTARVDGPGGPFRLIGVHLLPPRSRTWSEARNAQLEAIAARLVANEPVVVLGDFNLTPYSPHFRGWLARSGLRDSAAGRGLGFTWPTFMPLLGIPIDHCLVGPGLTVTERRRLPKFGSDHYPLLIRLLRNPAP